MSTTQVVSDLINLRCPMANVEIGNDPDGFGGPRVRHDPKGPLPGGTPTNYTRYWIAYNACQPIDESEDGTNITHPHILPLYYGFLAINEAIGTTGDSYVASLGTLTTNLTSYGIYENKQLTRVVLINKQVYNGTGEREGYNVAFDGWAEGRSASDKRLAGPVTQTLNNVQVLQPRVTSADEISTWGEQSFDTIDGTAQGEEVREKLSGSNLYIEASSVALIQLE